MTPKFVEDIRRSFLKRRKNVVLLTGNVLDLFWNEITTEYLPLEEFIYTFWKEKFYVLRFDVSSGVSLFREEDSKALEELCNKLNQGVSEEEKISGSIVEKFRRYQQAPVAFEILKTLMQKVRIARWKGKSIKPVCVIIPYADALFPTGEFARLNPTHIHNIVAFMQWLRAPEFRGSGNLIIPISETLADMNAKIFNVPTMDRIRLDLPESEERRRFVTHYIEKEPDIQFGSGDLAGFVEDTAGLRLTHLQDLLDVAAGTGQPLKRADILAEVNTALEAQLGDTIKVLKPSHGPADLFGYHQQGKIFQQIFHWCEDRETAIAAFLVAGPNGVGKSYQLEGYANASGRIVIRLANIRGQYFGQTDKLFEMIRSMIKTYGKILIFVDEADTFLGSVSGTESHQTERRLMGNIISMMSSKEYLGKVVWALTTARPQNLDPDIISRCPIQVPLFDLEGEERKEFVTALLKYKKVEVQEEHFEELLQRTQYYSARDFDNFARQVRALKSPVLEVLKQYSASEAIIEKRRLQSLHAANFCTYPKLIPESIQGMSSAERAVEIRRLEALGN